MEGFVEDIEVGLEDTVVGPLLVGLFNKVSSELDPPDEIDMSFWMEEDTICDRLDDDCGWWGMDGFGPNAKGYGEEW